MVGLCVPRSCVVQATPIASETPVLCTKNTTAQAAPGVSFNKDYLYDGPWRVLWKTNTAWQRYFDPLNSVADNRAYQWYKEVRR